MAAYICWNGAIPSTGPQVAITLTNAQKTQLQITTPSTDQLTIVEWGFSMNGAAVDTGVQVELLTTAGIAGGTPTAVVPTLYGDPNAPASLVTAGFGPTTEGSIVTVRMLDSQYQQKLGSYFKQYPLGERPLIAVSQVLRIRTNTPALSAFPNILAYVIWEE